ncbi:MAG: PAS domain-containing sensor histidine kinase [Bacteroidetes bacterium]|nr:PAS domain-containing sensor histidine kinase [Bacteroidota bacterium]
MNLTTLLKLASTRLNAERGGTSTSDLAYAEVDSGGNLVVVNPLAKMKWGWQKGSHVQREMQIALEGLAGTQPTELPLKLGGLHIGAIVRSENGGWQVFGYDPKYPLGPWPQAITETQAEIGESPEEQVKENLRSDEDESHGDEDATYSEVSLRDEDVTYSDVLYRDESHDEKSPVMASFSTREIRLRPNRAERSVPGEQLHVGLNTLRLLATTSPDHAVFCDSAMQTMATALDADRVLMFIQNVSGDLAVGSESQISTENTREQLVFSGETPILGLVEAHGSSMLINRSIAPGICSRLNCSNAIVSIVRDHAIVVGYVFVVLRSDKLLGDRELETLRTQTDRLVSCFESLYGWITIICRYRDLLSTIDGSVFSFHVGQSGSRNYCFFSDRLEQISGYKAYQITGTGPGNHNWIDDIVEESDRELVRSKTLALRSGDEISMDYRIVHRNGSIRWVRERARPSTDSVGFHRISGTLTDVTEIKAMEVTATDAQDVADSSRRSKTAFIATLSHEVRTPVGALNGYAQLLQKELVEFEQTTGSALPEQIHEFANVLNNRSHKLQTLVHDLFELSNLEMGSGHVHKERVSLHDVIQKCSSIEAPRLQRKGIQLILELTDEDPIVLSDAHSLEQVVNNVLSNATKFTESGSVTIRTSIEDSTAILEVEDTGIGISDDYQHSLFEPYSQEEDWRTRKFGGIGLGLALSRRLLEQFDGRIEVESKKGKGSIFRILLPNLGS